jgi:FixJ family two-component response regulator
MDQRAFSREDAKPLVFVVDDDASVRDAVEDLLGSVGLEPRTFAASEDFLTSARSEGPCCLVLDIRMPGMSGLEFQQAFIQSDRACPVIFITAHGDVQMCARAMKAGAVDFLTKPFRDQDLLDAIQRALQIDRVRRREAAFVANLRNRYASLNDGEREVMRLVVAGRLNKQIAAELGLSEITVKVRRGQVMRKMDAQSLPDLVRLSERLAVCSN